jgi:peptidyl-prolyl cis-trans isomerase B (cyclophilin B)
VFIEVTNVGFMVETCRVGVSKSSQSSFSTEVRAGGLRSRRDSLYHLTLGTLLMILNGDTVALAEEDSPEVTDRVFLEVGSCSNGYRKDRKLGDRSILCEEPDVLGRIVIDLYGTVAPGTVANFKRLIQSNALEGTVVNKVFAGRYIVAGQQGAHRFGFLEAPEVIESNSDLLNPAAFRLKHSRPGTVSLNLSNNPDEDYVKGRKDYRELSFLITTGPAPVPSLDEENIVFGRVSEGLDVIARIAEVPTFKPNESLQVFTDLAQAIGDDRFTKKKATFGKPLVPVVFVRTGILT